MFTAALFIRDKKNPEKHALTDGYQNVVKPQSVVLFSHKKK